MFIQVPTAKFRTWPQRGVSTDEGSYDYLLVRAVIDFKETSKPEIGKRSLTRFEPMA